MSIARPLKWKLLRTPPTRRLRSRERQVLVTRPHCEPRLAAALMLIRPLVMTLVTARVAWLTGSAISAASPETARTPKSVVVDAAAHAGAALISSNVPANAFNMRETPRVAGRVYTILTARTTARDTRSTLIGTAFTARLAGYMMTAHDCRPRENLESAQTRQGLHRDQRIHVARRL